MVGQRSICEFHIGCAICQCHFRKIHHDNGKISLKISFSSVCTFRRLRPRVYVLIYVNCFQGLVNGVDLPSLSVRYLSFSQPQVVTTPLQFRGRVHFRDTLAVDTLSLDGLIKVPKRWASFQLLFSRLCFIKKERNVSQRANTKWNCLSTMPPKNLRRM